LDISTSHFKEKLREEKKVNITSHKIHVKGKEIQILFMVFSKDSKGENVRRLTINKNAVLVPIY